MSLRALQEAFVTEIRQIRGSWYRLSLLTIAPLFCFFLVASIFSRGVATDLPVAVVDNDRSSLSRDFLFSVDATETIDVRYRVDDLKSAMALVRAGKAYGAVVIPEHFARDIRRKRSPTVTAFLNTQYILIGKIVKAALLETALVSSAKIAFAGNLAVYKNAKKSAEALAPIAMQVNPFFNPERNYFYFLVSALLPSIWQIFIVIATIVSFGTLHKSGKQKRFFDDGQIVSRIAGKLLPHLAIFMLLGLLFTYYIYGYAGWPFHGSFVLLFFGMLLTILAYQAVALLLFALEYDYARALSFGAVYTAPAFAFLGITFPVYAMNGFALFLRDILPVSHYIELQISQANYGASAGLEAGKLAALFGFSLVFIPAVALYRRKLAR